jgi:hypothetical protein
MDQPLTLASLPDFKFEKKKTFKITVHTKSFMKKSREDISLHLLQR